MKHSLFLGVVIPLLFANCSGPSLEEMNVGSIEIEGTSYEVYLLGSDSTETTGYFNYEKIELRTEQTADPFITVDSLDYYAYTFEGGEPGFASLDYTFDGYADIQIQSDEFMYQTLPHDLWIYVPEEKTFKYNSLLMDAPDAYFDRENELVIMTYFDRAITTTTSYYSYEGDDFELVKKFEEVMSFSGINFNTTSEKVNGVWVETNKEVSLGGVDLKKSGELTNQDEIASFLQGIGENYDYTPVIDSDGDFLTYNESCVVQGFSLFDENLSDQVPEYLAVYRWDSMHEGPTDYGAVVKISYYSSGEKFTLYSRSMYAEMYENNVDFYLSDEVDEILNFSYSSENGWVVKKEYDSQTQHYLRSDRADELPESVEECDGYDY